MFHDKVGRKTHIRIYVLITKIDNKFRIYLYKDNLIFCAVKEYTPDDFTDQFSNLTNLHLGSIFYDKFLKVDGKIAYKDLSFPLKQTVNKMFGKDFYSRVVYPQLRKILKVVLDNSVDYLRCDEMNKSTRGCFQTIAIDLMPDETFKLHLLEINASPGFNAPYFHWKGLKRFANSILARTSDIIRRTNSRMGNVNNGFTLIK
jgi:hypothetical protein